MKIGILGGGQLGRMFIQEALKYDDTFYVLDPSADCPCANISHFVQGNFNTYDDVLAFGQDKDVITIEIEHVNVDALEELERMGKKVVPSPAIIKVIQQKILQKDFYKQHNIPSPEYTTIQNLDDAKALKFPFVQKLNTGGYDGKGVQVIASEEELNKMWDAPSVIENLVDIDKELSVIVAINERGDTKTFPVTEMVADPKLNLLDFNICPANIDEAVQSQIETITQKFLRAVSSPGLFAIELFLDKDGMVWVNETAPRLHNSGHQTQEGNANSQFEQFYRVVTNRPLANTEEICFSGMLNLVGEDGYSGKVEYKGIDLAMALPNAYVHLYGKTDTKPGRKMGHINVTSNSRQQLIEDLMMIKNMVRVVAE